MYKALYRTHRPSSFEEMVGQEHIVQTLKNAIEQNRISHSIIFSGPRGTGKTSAARLFAKAVNCESSANKPCNQCSNCLAVNDSSHPDVVELDAASNNGVDEIRDIVDKVKYLPIKGKFKVYIIDEVHMLSTGASNALLKTLEEPPAHVIFILATTDVHKILPTIISRSQRFDFAKISLENIKSRLKTILKYEKIKCDDEVVELVAKLSDGGMRDALSILDQLVAYAVDDLMAKHVHEIFGLASKEELLDLLSSIVNKDVVAVLNKVDNLTAKGADIKLLTSDLLLMLKDILLANLAVNSEQHFSKVTSQQAGIFNEKMKRSTILNYIDILTSTYSEYKSLDNIKFLFQLALIKLIDVNEANADNLAKHKFEPITVEDTESKLSTFKQPEQHINKIEPLLEEDVLTKVTTKKVSSSKLTLEKGTEISEEEILNVLVQASKISKEFVQSKWNLLKKYEEDPMFKDYAKLLLDGKIVAACDNIIILVYQYKIHANRCNSLANLQVIMQMIKTIFDNDYLVYGVVESRFNLTKDNYMELRQINRLPEPRQVELPTFDNSKIIKKKEAVKDLNDVFTDIVKYGEFLFGVKVEIE